jgi:hypothetical protein
MTRVSINLHKKMDCRIKSGNDAWGFFIECVRRSATLRKNLIAEP